MDEAENEVGRVSKVCTKAENYEEEFRRGLVRFSSNLYVCTSVTRLGNLLDWGTFQSLGEQ